MTVPAIGQAPALLQLNRLTENEAQDLEELENRLSYFRPRNAEAEAYYEAKRQVQLAHISVPAEVAERIRSVIGWAGSVVDALEERLDWYGWTQDGGDDLGLEEIFDDNALDVDSAPGHLDALMFGTGFARVGTPDEGESPLITLHPPTTTTGVWDQRLHRMTAALTSEKLLRVIDLPGVTITQNREAEHRPWTIVERDEHGRDRIPVARFVNRPRTSRTGGRSEISRAIRYYCDAGVRTLLGTEVNREFYSIPQMTLLGRGRDAFVDKDGKPVDGWRILAGHALAIDKDDDGDVPTIGQLAVSSPEPFLAQLRGLASMIAAESGMPADYLGFTTDNPSSADAIRAGEARLVKRAERRQRAFGRTWMQVGALALLWRDGAVPDDYARRVSVTWRDAATPTRAAAADEAVKLVGAGILPPDSPVTLSRIGLSPTEIKRLESDRRRTAGRGVLDAIRQQAETVTNAPQDAQNAPQNIPELTGGRGISP